MGMLERAPACLEQGGRRILVRTPRQFRSRRALHSAFWAHGAGEIDLPPWWISLLQRPPFSASSDSQRVVDSTGRCLSASLTNSGFLDFLYPTKTLTLIHQLAVRSSRSRKNRQKLIHSPNARTYTSGASERQAKEYDQFPSLLSNSDQYHAKPSPSSSRYASKKIDATSGVTRQSTLQSPLDAATLATRGQQIRELWMRVVGPSDARTQDAEAEEKSLQRLSQLQQTALREHGQYLDAMLENRRSKLGIRYFSARLKALFHLKDFNASLRLYEEALDRHQDHEATPTILRLALDFENWTLAWKAYMLYKQTLQDESYFWKEMSDTESTMLMEKAFRLGDYAIQKLTKNLRGEDLEGLQEFAIKFIEESLTAATQRSSIVEPRLSEKAFNNLVKLMGNKKMTYDQYSSAIRQFLQYSSYSKADLAEAGFRAIRVYHQMRQNSSVYPEQELIEGVLVRACDMHHCTAKAIYSDFKSLYGVPNPTVIQSTLAEMEYQADIKGFYSVFDDGHGEKVVTWDSRVMLQILRIFSRRRQASEAQKVFDSIERLTDEPPNIAHWNALIGAFANEEDIDSARSRIKSMTDKGIDPSAETYEPLFKYYARLGDVEAIETLQQTLKNSGLGLRNFVFESYIQAHIENQQFDRAERALAQTSDIEFDGSRSRMWGQLAIAYARMRMKDGLEALRTKMREAGISEGDEFCQALMISHNWDRKPFRALKIIERDLPDKGIVATSYHYALVMSGFIGIGDFRRASEIEQHMLDRGVAPDFSIKTLKIRAAGRQDTRMYGENWAKEGEKRVLRHGEAALRDVLESSDRMDLGMAHDYPLIGIQHATYEDAYAGNYFNTLLTMYSSEGAWQRAALLYDQYIAHARRLAPERPVDPPLKLISWLMGAFRQSGDFHEVERGWKLAIEKSAKLAAREGADLAAPEWVLPARRYILALPMMQYMLSLFDTKQLQAVEALVTDAHRMGFALDSRNWNTYVQGHAAIGDPRLAFITAERELMPGWKGWPDRNGLRPRHLIGTLDWWQPREHETLRKLPTYKTMVLLARAYTRLQEQWMVEGRRKEALRDLLQVAPRAVEEVTLLPRINDRFQRGFLINL